ncbi:MAG: hypothetical protein SPK09_00560 [Porphyromonas sp.]|nr:hypothetical protein [Porphyromonas sp.]
MLLGRCSYRIISLLGLVCLWGQALVAQRLEQTPPERLSLEAEVETFFRNNEYGAQICDDYTLPGYRLRLNLDYNTPTRRPLRLKLGLSNLYYWGASLYPNAPYYIDLPYWSDEGRGYSRFRLRPFVQASIRLHPRWELTLGSLHGAVAHRLIEPLYNPELRLTADYETGIQLRHSSERLSLDAWVDWRSFIFRRAKHQEAFVAGARLDYDLLSTKGSALTLRAQTLWGHRGGIENIVPDTVHTWGNTALGLQYQYRRTGQRRPLTFSVGTYLLTYTQRGGHYASDSGLGSYSELGLAGRSWGLGLAGWYARGYMGVLSTPFVQSELLRSPQGRLYSPSTSYLKISAGYSVYEGQWYTLGCRAAMWMHPRGSSTMAEVYLSIRPRFVLLRGR